MELEQMVMQLDDLGDTCFRIPAFKYDTNEILLSLSAAMNLKNRGELKETVCAALASATGCSKVADFDVTSLHVPSGVTLSRKQIIVDAALCCWWASYLRNFNGAIYVFADSSPQVSVDWLLSIIQLIKETDLQQS